LARQKILEEELDAYQGDIQSLNTQAENLVKAGISNILVIMSFHNKLCCLPTKG